MPGNSKRAGSGNKRSDGSDLSVVFMREIRSPPSDTRHCTPIRYVIPLSATQVLPAEVPAGGRPGPVNSTAPSPDSAAIRLLFLQVPARSVNKKIAVRFLQPPLAEIMQMVGFALPHGDKREPAAALAAPAAGRDRGGLIGFHTRTDLIATGVSITDLQDVIGILAGAE